VFTTLGSGGGTAGDPGGKAGANEFCRVPNGTGEKLDPSRRKLLAAGCKVKLVSRSRRGTRGSSSSSRARPARSSPITPS
jgi:hypothetical protein